MLSTKKLFFLSAVLCIAPLNSISFAAAETVECSTNKLFGDNECGVCYKESNAVTGTGTALEITGVKVPWKNNQTGISEVAFEIDNDIPKIISDHKIVTDPDVLDDLWKFTNPWTGIGEYALASGKETTLTELVEDGSIKVYGKGSTLSPTVLIKSELNYVDREVAKLKESESKTRNICLLYDLTFSANNLNSGNSATTPPVTPVATNTPPATPVPAPTTTTPPATNSATITPPVTPSAPTTPVAPIPKPTTTTASTTNTNSPAPNTITPPPTNTTNTASTNTTAATNTPSTTNPPTASAPTNNTVINPQTTTPLSSTTNNTVQSYTSPVVQLNSAADTTTIAASKVPTGPAENTILLFIAVLLSSVIYWKKQKNSV